MFVRIRSILMGLSILGLLAQVPTALAEDEVLTIQGTSIRGNQELPTILYLVPWQAPEVLELDQPQASLAVTRPIEPLERAEFKRLIRYHNSFKQQHAGELGLK